MHEKYHRRYCLWREEAEERIDYWHQDKCDKEREAKCDVPSYIEAHPNIQIPEKGIGLKVKVKSKERD